MTEAEKLKINQAISDIKENVKQAAERSGRKASDIRIVLATKTQTPEKINYAISCGISEIGENRVQELLEKYDSLNRDGVKIHFIGTLQTNKVKYIVDKVDLIHSVNSKKLAAEIDRQSAKHGKISDVLIEINADDENSKTGASLDGLYELLEFASGLGNIRVRGLMAIPPAPHSENKDQIFDDKNGSNVNILQTNDNSRQYFIKIHQIFLDISAKKMDNISMDILSLGMSGDYMCAIEQGSTLIRPGRAVFGERATNISDTLAAN